MYKYLLTYHLLLFTMMLARGQQNPDPPQLNAVSVINDEGHVQINWSYSNPESIDGFIVYYYDPTKTPSPGIPFDTIFDPMEESFIDVSGSAMLFSVSYTVAAFKKLNDKTYTSPQTPAHFTVFLKPDWVECSSSIKLSWSPYVGWDEVAFYNIFENGVPIEKTTNTFFVRINAEDNQTYNYTIEAVSEDGKLSNSNSISLTTSFPLPADFINADYATVEENSIFLSFNLGNNGDQYDYILVSKPPSSSIFSDTLTTFSYSRQLDYRYLVSDILQQYQFKLISQDRCGRIAVESNLSSNIVLLGENNSDIVILEWTEYLNWLGGVNHYAIYRNTGDGFKKLQETDNLTFQDNISQFIDDNQTSIISYYIEAVEGVNNPFGISGISKSNTFDVYLENQLKFPTAFTPNDDGMNDIFRPLNLYFMPEKYFLTVFDRWGKKVFETNQPDTGWDGNFSTGKKVTEGVYHYFVKYNNAEGIEISKTGVVTVLYP